MPTTTKMGIVYPSSTDLVKDGATAMGTISTTVDAKTGLVLLNTTSFTTQSSVSLAANTFSATYNNYLIQFNWLNSTGTAINLRFRASGSDDSSSNYYFSGIATAHNSATISSQRGSGVSQINSSANISTSRNYATIRVADVYTTNTSKAIMDIQTSGGFFESFGGLLSNSNLHDSLSLFVSSGTITGTYSVYGVNS
jgi:hypothetical protein